MKRYSSGMSVRLAFAVAAHLEPEILLVDEVLAVGDAEFQRRCLGRMEDLSQSGRTVVFVSHQMQAVAQLCDRVVLLEKGSIVLDGASGDVVAHYLQLVEGSTSERVWPDIDTAPGDDLVRLLAVRVVNESGDLVRGSDVRRPVGIEITFTSAARGGAPRLSQDQAVRRTTQRRLQRARHEFALARACSSRDYASTAWIPGNLLNEGLMTVDVGVCSVGTLKLHPHAGANDVVSFHVQDSGEGDSAKGPFTGQLHGVVRPLLKWTTRQA